MVSYLDIVSTHTLASSHSPHYHQLVSGERLTIPVAVSVVISNEKLDGNGFADQYVDFRPGHAEYTYTGSKIRSTFTLD